MNKITRTRYAPSPTGFMHIGNLRTALYEYLIAKKNGGQFILRIEDTDQERYVDGAEEFIYNTLKMAGIYHDEGPDIGGNYGPYVQSKRKDIYMEYAKKLINSKNAYYCFCSRERLARLKDENETLGRTNMYDRHCLNLNEEEINEKIKNRENFVIRQKMPDEGVTTFEDLIFGKISVNNKELDDQILIKADGLPTYNFANVVDDNLMEVTHVIRGSEYLSSAPKYNLLYEAFGWNIPQYIHVPMIMKNKSEKFSKRDGDASFIDLIERGYLVEAVVNYIALLGWSPGGTQEIFSLEELKKVFDPKGISKSPAIFDIEKLNWMNAEYIRKMTDHEFYEIAREYVKKGVKNSNLNIKKICRILKQRTVTLKDIEGNVDFFDNLPEYESALYKHKRMKTDEKVSLSNLESVLNVLKKVEEWEENRIHDEIFKLIEEMGIKNGQMLWPIRTALTGKKTSPGGAIEIADILGKEETLNRIKKGIEKLKR